MEGKQIIRVLEHCKIHYKGMLISDERIIQDYMKFLVQDKKHKASISIRTGSICFDIISVIVGILRILSLDKTSNEDIIKLLEKDEMVMITYPSGYQSRRRWIGLDVDEDGDEVIKYSQDGDKLDSSTICKIKRRDFNGTIRRYNGDSNATGSKGIVQRKTNREDFLSKLFNIGVDKVPACFDVTLAVLADKELFEDIIKNVMIVYDNGKSITLNDLVPFSYVTREGDEYQIGQNVAKDKPVVYCTEQLVMLKDLMIDNKDRAFGVLILKDPSNSETMSDVDRLLSSSVVKYIDVLTRIDAPICEYLVNMDEQFNIYFNSKKKMAEFSGAPVIPNRLTLELQRGIKRMRKSNLDVRKIQGELGGEELLDVYNKLKNLKGGGELMDNFRIGALAFLKLYRTACFSFRDFERLLNNGHMDSRVDSPKERLQKLREIATGLNDQVCSYIVDKLELIGSRLLEYNKKNDELKVFLNGIKRRRKVQIVVAKAYYVDILKSTLDLKRYKNISICTTSKYNAAEDCDIIIAFSGVPENRFNPYMCTLAGRVVLFVYDNEMEYVSAMQKKSSVFLKKIDMKKNGIQLHAEELGQIKKDEEETRRIVEDYESFDEMVKKLELEGAKRFLRNGEYEGKANQKIEVANIGIFTTGEKILFSRYYDAVVFDEDSGEVAEKGVDELSQGDTLLFLKKNKYTQNIVDYVFGDLKNNNKLSESTIEAYRKSLHWREVLKKYKEDNNLKATDLHEKFKEYGVNYQIPTIRTWVAEDSRIVGPRNENVISAIGRMTNDVEMTVNPGSFYEAFSRVRNQRQEILKLLSQAMKDKMSGNIPEPQSLEEQIYQSVDEMTETRELYNIIKLEQPELVGVNYVNKPIRDNSMEE